MPAYGTLHNILQRAVHAPSGDNTQPWEFVITDRDVTLYNVPKRDGTLYNFKERGSYVGHGAVVENIRLLAAQAGYAVAIEPFPPAPHATARLTFSPAMPTVEPLCEAIQHRSTNRKSYRAEPLNDAHRHALLDSVHATPSVTVRLVEDSDAVETLARTFSMNEQLLMEYRPLHAFLFGVIRWTRAQERRTPGMYVKTMEFPAPVRVLLQYVLRHWMVVRFLNRFGLSQSIATQSARVYAASSAIGILTIPADTDDQFLEAGRALQRLWLTATSVGVSMQPVTALPYLAQRVRAHDAGDLSSQQQELILACDEQIRTLGTVHPSEHIAMIVRMGYGAAPSAHAFKLPPTIRDATH